jgi:hypothetical protein
MKVILKMIDGYDIVEKMIPDFRNFLSRNFTVLQRDIFEIADGVIGSISE